ncbi:tyrosine-type recombinase/integrase [Sphingomonas sp. ac-8]|uniref:tyrosine-type recombinase/integrase n=1 Tax=Sphingomonas sp. ac-8 TaxID=3242977 RepID=UPI003A7F675E
MGRKAADTGTRVQLGPYWLEYRAERDDWSICWYDPAARTRRRRKTGIGGGSGTEPPEAAREALARHYLEASKPAEPQPKAAAMVPELLTGWMKDHVSKKADSARYAISVQHLLRFFDREKRLGRIIGGVTVADVNKAFVDRFIAYRMDEGVGGHTISRDLAALRGSLNWAWREELIEAAPFVKDVDAKAKAKPRDLTYSMEQVAALLEATWGRPERHHVMLYTMIALSTCGRGEAILDLHDHQIDGGLIYFLDPDRDQTSKRRSIVPIAPTLAPWLDGAKGKIIRYRAELARERWTDPATPEFFERDCYDLGNAFDACLIEAGISRPVLDADGKPVMLPARRKLGETEARPRLRGRGTPNTLRHTAISEMHRRGVDERQIDMAAGHAPIGTGKRNYMHLRPDYLAELITAVEDYWQEMRRFTTVHLRSQCGPSVVSLAAARAGRRVANG